jgi:hypothetical protein
VVPLLVEVVEVGPQVGERPLVVVVEVIAGVAVAVEVVVEVAVEAVVEVVEEAVAVP